jgi:hypothetical protein
VIKGRFVHELESPWQIESILHTYIWIPVGSRRLYVRRKSAFAT